ncbi:MAG: aldo/keto reductase, partial [Pseudomonadota bacterium]
EQLELLADIRGILTSEGHTLPQAALAWLLTYSDTIIPIPGFKTLAQIQDSAGVLTKGLLTPHQMALLDERLTAVEILIR